MTSRTWRQWVIPLSALSLALAILGQPRATDAQPAPRIPRIGILPSIQRPEGTSFAEAFEQGLRELGYFNRKNIALEYRWNQARQPAPLDVYAAELVRLNADVIVVGSGRAAREAKKATNTIPIVIAVAPDPVAEGLVVSLARPGGNVTGLSFLSTELASKQLDLLKTTVPGISRVGVFWTSRIPSHPLLLREMEVAARTLGLTLQPLEIGEATGLDGAFAAMLARSAQGLLVLPNSAWLADSRVHDLSIKHRLPAIYSIVDHADKGGLLAYGANPRDNWRRAAAFVDKILKGAKPGDLPIEQPTRFELVLNLKTAKALGLAIPQAVMLRADRIIE